MNTETGHLVTGNLLKEMLEEHRQQYQPVPDHLSAAATRALAGREETYIPKRGRSQLAKWAAEQRRERKRAEKAARKQHYRKRNHR